MFTASRLHERNCGRALVGGGGASVEQSTLIPLVVMTSAMIPRLAPIGIVLGVAALRILFGPSAAAAAPPRGGKRRVELRTPILISFQILFQIFKF